MKSLFLLIFPIALFSQKKTVIDSLNKKPVPFANIKLLNSKQGFYTDEKGTFEITNSLNQNDSILVSCLGYYPIKKLVHNINDTIVLSPKTETLKEVIISTKKPVLKKVGFRKTIITWFPGANFQIGVLLKPAKKEKTFINKIRIPTKKKKWFDGKKQKESPKYNSIIKLMLYSIKNNLPYMPLLTKPIIINCTEKSKKNIEVDLSEEFIEFDADGLFIAVEMVGELDANGNVVNTEKENRPALVFSDIPSDDFSLAKLFVRRKSTEKWMLLDAKKMHEKKDFLLALKLELAYYNE